MTLKPFSFLDRNKYISSLQNQKFDLCIIGGGITGAGVARAASLRGMKVALIEEEDFASGTSSRSSKLIHGGLRYLENLEFHLVFEALTERTTLFEMAPHLIHPLRFLLPTYKDFKISRFKMGTGMWLYDLLSLFETPKMHESLSREKTLKRAPFLASQNLTGSFVYSDAYMDDDRLVCETLRSANHHGAICVNYVKAIGAEWKNNKVCAITCRDQSSGKTFSIQTHHTVSCAGPWTDQVGSLLLSQWKKKMRPTKGVHLTFSKNRIPLKEAVVMVDDRKDRIVFAIPREDMVIVGTTDTDYKDDPRLVHTSQEDVDYLLNMTAYYFPHLNLQKEDIIASYAGVRPLVHDGSPDEGKTSREHLIFNDPRGITFVMGGKYTTYRVMAEDTLKHVLRFFPLEKRIQYDFADTKSPLNPKVTLSSLSFCPLESWSHDFQTPLPIVKTLFQRHGGEAEEILQIKTPFKSSLSEWLWTLEAAHAIKNTMCGHLLDFYLRRSPLFLADPSHGFTLIKPLAQVFQNHLNWTEAQRQKEEESLKHHLHFEMGWKDQG
ncbi:MAG: glycerol-3-phosphate dehydrogenase/oxidase [Bdellovibrio sp.]|nr:MAG: glycerol-3-phosphate dehydrogenase/oxidase [Bdellovibrio sp.]